MAAKTISILLAEDDPDDRYLIGEALEENLVTNKLYIVEDGEELLDYLYQRGKYHETGKWPRPGLILMAGGLSLAQSQRTALGRDHLHFPSPW